MKAASLRARRGGVLQQLFHMSDIYVVIRNQANVAMASIEGEPIRVFVRRERLIYDEQPVSLRFADAFI